MSFEIWFNSFKIRPSFESTSIMFFSEIRTILNQVKLKKRIRLLSDIFISI